MKEVCPFCYSDKTKQTSIILTRILISTYIFLGVIFFTGEINLNALLALIPLIIPYKNICINCNKIFYKIVPKWNKSSLIKFNTSLIRYLLAIAPTILMISLLIVFFPYTGLGRLIYLPFIFLINSVIVIISLNLTRNSKCVTYHVSWIMIILLTSILTIIFYPQETGVHVIKEIIP